MRRAGSRESVMDVSSCCLFASQLLFDRQACVMDREAGGELSQSCLGAPVYSRAMTAADRPVHAQFRWGLAAKLFAILILLGAIAVLVTGGLGYVRAHDALEETIYNQLTAARQAKTRQVE